MLTSYIPDFRVLSIRSYRAMQNTVPFSKILEFIESLIKIRFNSEKIINIRSFKK